MIPFLQTFKKIYLLVTLLFCFVKPQSQCNPPDQLPTVECINAPVVCLQDACYTTTDEGAFGWNGFCGANTAIHNPQYFEIIPTDDLIEIHIHVDDCEQGSTALQAALVTSCDWVSCPGGNVPCADVLDCDPGTGVGGTMVISAQGLTPGESLWLIIDGSSGSQCQYTFDFITGVLALQIDEELDSAQTHVIPNIVCQGYDDLHVVTGPPITNASIYIWTLGWNNNTITSNVPEINLDVDNNAPPGIWDICVIASSGCDTTNTEVCVQVEIVEIEDIVKEAETFCLDDFPFLWHNINITGPGNYSQAFDNSNGCSYDSLWTVDAYPLLQPGVLDTIHCTPDFVYEGVTYFNSGSYLLIYPGMGMNGCDSFAELNLTIGIIDLFIEHSCVDSQSLLTPQFLASASSFDTITYEWFNCGFAELLSTSQNLEVSELGCYCLVINTGLCIDTICSTYNSNPCDLSCSLAQDMACLNDSVLFAYDGFVSPGSTFNWLIDVPGISEAQYFNSDSVLVRFDSLGCFRASLTIINDSFTVTCIDTICVKGVSTEASICCSIFSCQPCYDLTISLTGNAPWTIVLSNNNILDTVTGILASPYVHTVCPGNTNASYSLVEVFSIGDVCPGLVTGVNTVFIEHIDPPVPTLTSGDSFICVSGGFTYEWHECDSSTILGDGVCFIPPSSGCYCVDKIFSESCTLTACIDFIVGINDPENKSGIMVYPNPTKEFLQIQMSADIPLPMSWNLCDQLGIQHAKGIIKERTSHLDLEKIPPGLYFINFKTGDDQEQTFKVIIE